jgi:hypothetical protein
VTVTKRDEIKQKRIFERATAASAWVVKENEEEEEVRERE